MTLKSVLITGCSEGGIGHSLAENFQKQGFRVFATARTVAKMSSLEKLPNVTLLPLDVTSSVSIAAAVKAIQIETRGDLHCLVNNAGYLYVMPALDIDLEEAKKVFDVNLWGTLAMTKAFSPLLIRASGAVVNISSVLGFLGLPWTSTYGASKAALKMTSEMLRMELKPLGVKVLTINSGLVKTNLASNSPVFRLSSTSPYLSIEAEIAEKAKMKEVTQLGMAPDVFAQRLVRDVLRKREGTVWRGGMSFTFRCLHTLLPRSLLEMVVKRGSGLDKIQHSEMPASTNAEAPNNDISKEHV